MRQDLPFGTQLLGQVEKTLSAILGRLLAGSGVTEPQWVTLSVLVGSPVPVSTAEAARRAAAALTVDGATAGVHLQALVEANLVSAADRGGSTAVTPDGRAFHASVRARVGELVPRLWGDLPADDLAVTADVLNTVLRRATTELARLTPAPQ